MGHDKQLELEDSDAHAQDTAGLPDTRYFLPLTGGIPHEAGLDDKSTGQEQGEPAEVHQQLLNFFLFGIRPESEFPREHELRVVPALTYPYCDLSHTRHDFPFCLDDKKEPADTVRTLPDFIDSLIARIDIEGDEGERLKQQIYRLESEIRVLSDQDEDGGLLGLWDRAARNLINASKLDDAKKEQFRDNLAAVRQGIDSDYEMISCNACTAEKLFSGLAGSYWKAKCHEWNKELGSLIQHLMDILEVDFNHSPEARSPEHLRESSGTHTDDFDFTAFSSILTSNQPGNQLPEERRDRIRSTLETLLRIRPVYTRVSHDNDPPPPFSVQSIFTDCDTALAEYNARMELMTEFFRAVQIARLETGNAYRESNHDDFFRRFDITYLTEAELSLCPPVLLKLDCKAITGDGLDRLLEVLNTGYGIKVLLQINDLSPVASSRKQTSVLLGWPANLASMVSAMAGVYVLQAPVSNLTMCQAGLLAGLEYAGPSLFSVYAGNVEHRPDLPVYLDAGSATESRVFPAFISDPSRGPDLADRFHVAGNSRNDEPWPLETFNYRAAEGNETAVDTAFTAAEFLLNDRRLADHFWNVPHGMWNEEMVPLHEYLLMPPAESAAKLPYILTVNQAGELGKTLVSRSILASVMQCTSNWRHLQELGGINNSHARKVLEAEKTRLADEKQQEVAEIEDSYNKQIDQDIGRLTEEIVQRIAGRLIFEAGSEELVVPKQEARQQPLKTRESPAETVEEKVEAQSPAAEEEEEDDDEIEGFDDPYIITQLCTSCNDCMNINKDLFAYDKDKKAYIKDPDAGTYEQLVRAAEKCPVHVIRPGKPRNPDEPGLEALLKRAAPYM